MFTYSFDKSLVLHDAKKPQISKSSHKRYVAKSSLQSQTHDILFSVIIVTYNEDVALFNLLESIQKQSFQQIEVIVVDNGLPSEASRQLEKDKTISYIKATDNLGPSLGRNVGAAHAHGKYLVFLDADGDIAQDYLSSLSNFVEEHPSAKVIRGKVLSKSNHDEIHSKPKHYDLGDEIIQHYPSTEGNSVWQADIFKKSGGFEDSLYGGEGIVLAYRLHEFYGVAIDNFYYVPDLVLYHDYNTNTKQLESKVRRTEIARKKVDLRYPLLQQFLKCFATYDTLAPGTAKSRDRHDHAIQRIKDDVKREFQDYADTLLQTRRKKGRKFIPKRPIFSVIIPHYNLGEMVQLAVDSVLRQTFDSFEVIVVDDCSPDKESLAHLKPLEDTVKVIYQKKNTGVAGARNTGIKAAKGKYILCLDADDTIEPEYLEQAHNLFESFDEVGIVSTWVKLFGDRNGHWRPVQDIGVPEALVDSPIPTASCFRKEAWEQAGGYYEPMRGYEDWHMWVSILSQGWKIKVIPYVNFNYYVRPGSKVNTSNKNAVNLVSAIIANNRPLYEQNMEYIIATKHSQVVQLRQRVRHLENKHSSLKSQGKISRKVAKAFKLSLSSSKEIVSDSVRDRSIMSGLQTASKKMDTVKRLTQKKLKK